MPTTDEDLVRRFARAQTPVDTTDVVSRVKLEARMVWRRRQLGTVALAFVVIAGTIGGVVALDNAFRGAARPADRSPSPAGEVGNGLVAFEAGGKLYTTPETPPEVRSLRFRRVQG